MRLELCLMFVIFLTLNSSQDKVQGISNIGLVVQNLTRLTTDEACDRDNGHCKYYMELCFSFAKSLDCSFLDHPSLTWVIKPGESKVLSIGDPVFQCYSNPLRFRLRTWKAQEVVLRANVRTTEQPDFNEEILIKERLPYPINDLKRLEENKITNCSAHFCLTVSVYMWCDDIPGCAGACARKPCQNEGVCVNDGNGGYQCECTPNWEDKNCELLKWGPESFSKRGCYRVPRPRPTTTQHLFDRREFIDWFDGWDQFLETIVNDCGKAAKIAGYRYFCIEFFGECWGYKEFDTTQPYAGAQKCWGKRPNFLTCNHDEESPICVGTDDHGYFYEIN